MFSLNKRSFYSVSRALHIYLSTALFFLLIIFCVSGIILNHVSWLENDKHNGQNQLLVSAKLFEKAQANLDTLPSLYPEIEQYMQQQFSLSNVKSIEWEKEDALVMLDYPLPAGFAYAEIDFQTGELNIDYQTGGFMSLIGDLHKGRHTGKAWSWVIDISAVLMILFAITGLIILFQNRKKRATGLWLTLLGVATPLVIYLVWVPQLKGVS